MALSPLLDFLKAATGYVRPDAGALDEAGESAGVAARFMEPGTALGGRKSLT
jgi:hypothetical protein